MTLVFAVILGAFLFWRALDAIVAHVRLAALLRARGIVKASQQTAAARINPGPGRMVLTSFEGLEGGQRCFVIATKSIVGLDVALSVRPL